MKELFDLKEELRFLGLLDKAREIHSELGEDAVLSYIKSSHRLLSKVYHPDLNPGNEEKAMRTQQRLNRVSDFISRVPDRDLINLIREGAREGTRRKKKILVVEDEFGLQEMFRSIFTMEGYEASVAVDGDSGYKEYCRFRPDLVFTDVIMPRMNGIEMVRKIRKTEPRIKVVYVSGFFGVKGIKKDLDQEILKYGYPTISKPCKLSMLLDVVNEYMNEDAAQPFGVSVFA